MNRRYFKLSWVQIFEVELGLTEVLLCLTDKHFQPVGCFSILKIEDVIATLIFTVDFEELGHVFEDGDLLWFCLGNLNRTLGFRVNIGNSVLYHCNLQSNFIKISLGVLLISRLKSFV